MDPPANRIAYAAEPRNVSRPAERSISSRMYRPGFILV